MEGAGVAQQEQLASDTTHESLVVERNDYWAVFYDPELKCAGIDWLDYNPTAQFKAGSERMLEVVIEKRAALVLNNTEHLRMLGREEQQWVVDDFLPRLQRHGVRVVANVNSLHYFARLGVSLVMANFEDLIKSGVLITEYFSDKESARLWLQTLPPFASTTQ
jgi:hypothetical protein